MSVIKNLHRVISDIEDLQNKPAKADADRTMAEIERDEARAEVERLKKELDDEMCKAGEWIDIRTHRERVAAAVARISDRARKMESERDSEKARADKATAERDRLAVLLLKAVHAIETRFNKSLVGDIDAALAEIWGGK